MWRWLPIVLLGCTGGVAATHPALEPNVAATTTLNEAVLSDATAWNGEDAFGGVTLFIARSLPALALTTEERERFEPIASALLEERSAERRAEAGFFETLADSVSSGTIDDGKVEAGIDRLRVDASGVYDASTDTLDHLHALLSRDQRATLMDAVEARFTRWVQGNPVHEADRPSGQLAAVGATLGLGDDVLGRSRARFDVLMARSLPLDVRDVTSRVHAFERAFESSAFSAPSVPNAAIEPDLAGWAATRIANLCTALEQDLTPDQRGHLAALLRRDRSSLSSRRD